jgi:hypothetical protein
MLKSALLLSFIISFMLPCMAQDSVWVRLRPKYDKVGGIHRVFFGENYRREWSDSTYLPIIDISTIHGGLKPEKLGGGHQTVSLRLVDNDGNEWVLRNIEKDASVLLPPELRQTFARDVIDDAMSAQHPFSPLVVSELAEAVHVPHAHPLIGVVRGDTILGEYSSRFSGRVCLLEEREPMGNSDNSIKMFAELKEDNDNGIDGPAFLRARLLDLLIGDWDRHPDQWRWVDTRKGKTKFYVGIPRDRDQAFYLNEGVFPTLARRSWIVPILQGFKGSIRHVKYNMKEGAFMHSRPGMFIQYDEWMRITNEFVAALPDSVISHALAKLPAAAWQLRHQRLFEQIKQRRDNIPAAMSEYYRFLYRTAELQLSDKHEMVSLTGGSGGSLNMHVEKMSKNDDRKKIVDFSFAPDVTKELRIYTGKGNDSVVVDNETSPIRIRIVGDEGNKKYNVIHSDRKVRVYEKTDGAVYSGELNKMALHLSDDSANTAYVPVNRYNILMPLVGVGFNRDDGFILGLGFKYTKQGFRKVPYSSVNQLLLYHSFATSAYRIKYKSEWIHVFGKTDLVSAINIYAPENTQNFFGTGNETVFNKTGNRITYYRARFSVYEFSAGLRWKNDKGASFSVGSAIQHYGFDSADNKGRFLLGGGPIFTYDSTTISKNKTHAGVVADFFVDKRNNMLLPSRGYNFNIGMKAYAGISNYAKSFGQISSSFSLYVPLGKRNFIVLADRVGGATTVGKNAFYQSVFIGGHENLLGYRQYRFAGEHAVYNNLEARVRLANFAGYIVPGELGMVAFYDAGRVWVDQEDSNMWHQGAGGGLYFAPAKLAVLSVVAGHSTEGWYPYVTLGFRF